MSSDEQTVKLSVDNLQADHLLVFNRTLNNILSMKLAERTLAQIIDGLPTRDDVGLFPTYSIEIRDNIVSSLEATEAARGFREHFNTNTALVNASLAQAYQKALPGSIEFYLRLLEMLAVACHDIAGTVYLKSQPGLRREGQSAEQGVADVVGYWDEYHLFGGVVLFDRGETGTECKRAFLHPVGSFRIFQLSDSQIQTFVEYVQKLDEGAPNVQPPFPFSAEKDTYRVDPFDSMALNIYRDKYERVIPKERPTRYVQRLEDFPELQDAIVQVNRADSSQ